MNVVFAGSILLDAESVAFPLKVTLPSRGSVAVFRLPSGRMTVCAKAGATIKKRRTKKVRQEVKKDRELLDVFSPGIGLYRELARKLHLSLSLSHSLLLEGFFN